MKPFKKLISFFGILAILVFVFSCTNETGEIKISENLEELSFKEIEIPQTIKYNLANTELKNEDFEVYEKEIVSVDKFGNEVKGKIKITLPRNNFEKIISLQFTENIIEQNNLSSESWLRAEKRADSRGAHNDCIQKCKKTYTDSDGNKKKGRGACKANCWIDTAISILKIIHK